jgi:O-antigen/teichoic acid export membrane protein
MEFQRLLYKSAMWRSLVLLSQFVLNILVARYYEPEESGQLFYLLNNYAFLITILSFSIETGIGYYCATGKIAAGKLTGLSLLWTLSAAILTLVVVYFFTINEGGLTLVSVVMPLLFVTGNMLITFFLSLFFARKNFALPNMILLAGNLFVIVVVIAAGNNWLPWLSPEVILYIYVGIYLVQGIIMAIFFLRKNVISSSISLPDIPEIKMLIRFSLLAFISNFITFLVFRSDYWFIQYFRSDGQELGNYIQVSKIAQLFFAIPSFLASAIFPLTSGGLPKIKEDIIVLTRIIFFVSSAGCLLIALLGKWLFPFVFGELFNQMYLPFLLLVPGIISICIAYPLTSYFAGKNKIRINIYASLLALFFIVPGALILVPAYGIRGAAVVSCIGYMVLFITVFYNFNRESPVGLVNYLLIRRSDAAWLKKVFTKNVKNGSD